MLAYYAKRSPGEEFTEISRPLESGQWVDGSNLSDSEIDGLIHQYDLNANIVYDVRDHSELPRLETSGDKTYVFLRLPRLAKSGNVTALPLLCVMASGTFITLSIGDTLPPDSIGLSTIPITTQHTETLLLGVIAGVVATFGELMGHTARSINDTANRLKTHEITNRDFVHFVTVEDNLNSYRLNLESAQSVLRRLRENKRVNLEPDSIEALDDIDLHIQQLLVSVTSHTQSVESIRNAYGTIANNNLNQRMKTLTVFTVLITLPNVFYGMLGMNVVLPIPGREPWAFPVIVGFTFVVILIIYLVAKRMRVF
jgi:magnesium transporter